jgi:hypothetical protein
MSGPGDVDGEVSGDEAAWRDLVARLESPVGQATEVVPWPAREDIPAAENSRPSQQPAPSQQSAPSQQPGPPAPSEQSAQPAPSQPGPPAPSQQPDPPTQPAVPAPADIPGLDGRAPFDHGRIIRFAGDPRSYTPPAEEDEAYKPERLPPPARMDPVSKGAWVALIGGPGYLLLGTVLQWTISGTEALAAIGAFIAGFVILVVKMGDRPPRDDNDDGAVL